MRTLKSKSPMSATGDFAPIGSARANNRIESTLPLGVKSPN